MLRQMETEQVIRAVTKKENKLAGGMDQIVLWSPCGAVDLREAL